MPHAPHGLSASGSDYVVGRPRSSDVLSRALRDAYCPPEDDADPFADLLRDLDKIGFPPRQN